MEKKEAKQKKVKDVKGINVAQLALLKSFIGAGLTEEEDNEQGFLIQHIKESSAMDLGTKILYLERAMTEECDAFLLSLDKFYQAYPEDKEKNKENIELIRSLKNINDLCFNNSIVNGEHGVTSCLTNTFGRLRSEKVTSDNEAAAFKDHVQQMINANIKLLKRGHKKQVKAQIIARQNLEKTIPGNVAWRTLLELPLAQQTISLPEVPSIVSVNHSHLSRQAAPVVEEKSPLTTRFHFRLREEISIPHALERKRGTFFSPSSRLSRDMGGGCWTFHETQRVEGIVTDILTDLKTSPGTSASADSLYSDLLERLPLEALEVLSDLSTISSNPRSPFRSNLRSTPRSTTNLRSTTSVLDFFQNLTLTELHTHGLTPAHLANTGHWFNMYEHSTALVYLMTGRGSANMTADAALEVMSHMSNDQLRNIQTWQPEPAATPSSRRLF